MLRSRKKMLEKGEKKPSDAEARHKLENKAPSQDIVTDIVQPTKSENILPEPKHPYQPENINPAIVSKANQVDKWAHMIDSMQLTARIRQLAIHATICDESTDDNLILQLNQATKHLNTQVAQDQLESVICEFLNRKIKVTLNVVEQTVADPYQIQGHINDKRYDYAKDLIREDKTIMALQSNFQAILDEDSIAAR
jgi:DNA polymerase-3 subunit gamma/tau